MRAGDSAAMSTGDPAARTRAAIRAQRRAGLRRMVVPGGLPGNEQLTAITGVALIVLLAVLGVTILRIGQLISVHLFVGVLLIGPVALKLASTGYRFMRYYTGAPAYRAKGPPPLILRGIAPLVVATTLVVFISGVLLLFDGPAGRGPLLLAHKASFIVWLGFTALHVLGHLPGLSRPLRSALAPGSAEGVRGTGVRWWLLCAALVIGLVVAIALIPDYSAWTGAGAFHHHHD